MTISDQPISDQPPPIAQPDRVPVWSLVIADYRELMLSGDGDETDHRVIADMAERDLIGRERYGTPLTTGNGRNHLVDAYQEALDMSVYLRAWLEEHDAPTTAKGKHTRRKINNLYRDHLAEIWRLRQLISTLSEDA